MHKWYLYIGFVFFTFLLFVFGGWCAPEIYLYKSEWLGFLGAFWGALLGLLSLLAGAAYAFDLETKRRTLEFNATQRNLALALRHYCRATGAIMIEQTSMLNNLFARYSNRLAGEIVDLPHGYFKFATVPEVGRLSELAERISGLGIQQSEEVMSLEYLLTRARFALENSRSHDIGDKITVKELATLKQCFYDYCEQSIKARTVLSQFLNLEDVGPKDLPKLLKELENDGLGLYQVDGMISK